MEDPLLESAQVKATKTVKSMRCRGAVESTLVHLHYITKRRGFEVHRNRPSNGFDLK